MGARNSWHPTYLKARGSVFARLCWCPIRSSVYGRPGKACKEKTSWLHCGSSSTADDIDSASTSSMQSRIAKFTSELAAATDRAKQRELENEKRFQLGLLQSQLDTLLHSGVIIPPCPGDVLWCETGVGSLDDYSTEEEEEFRDEDEEFYYILYCTIFIPFFVLFTDLRYYLNLI